MLKTCFYYISTGHDCQLLEEGEENPDIAPPVFHVERTHEREVVRHVQ